MSRSRSLSSITTEQRDSSTRYVSRGGRRRSRSVRFARRVQYAVMRSGALQSFTDEFGSVGTITANQQSWDGFIVGGTTVVNNDIFLRAFQVAHGAALTSTTVDDYSLYVRTICTDFQFTNVGTSTLIMDFYSLLCRRNYGSADALVNHLSSAVGETPAQTGYSFSGTNVGYTLFQVPLFLQFWKILKKWQVQLGAGETTTFQVRIPVNRLMRGKVLETHLQAIPKLSRAVMWSVKGAPESNAGVLRYAAGSYVYATQTTLNYQLPVSSSRTQIATT